MSASNENNLSRRQALAGIALGGAAAVVPLSGAIAADRSAWNKAVAELRTADAVALGIGDQMSAAHDIADAACPRNEEFFRRYDMGCGFSSTRNFERAHRRIVMERTKSGKILTLAEAKQATADACRVVDDFETWTARHAEVFAEYDRLETQHDAAHDARWNARDALLATPAPDQDALLFKVELLSDIMRECATEDANRIGLISADARRLLARG